MKALITGASSGIGRDMARNLSKRGYDLILVARDENRLQELKKELEIYKVNIEIIAMDLAIEENCKELHKKVKDIDFLINNAGFGDCGDFTKTDLDKEIAMIHTNIIAYHILTKLYLIDMKKVNRGKILNVEKARLDRVYENAEIKAMITAFGTGIHEDFDITKLRYHKIIIMTDADVDGAHIATLLLTFIYRFMPELIKQGYVSRAQPPLYKLEKNKKVWYAYSDEELAAILDEVGRDQNNKIQRYKGLGEMDAEQLWDTTMDPKHRVLLKVNFDESYASDIDVTFNTLMGDRVEPRRLFIEKNAKYVKNLDI